VEPGDHRLCTNVQSKFERVVKSSAAATSFTAEAGKTYYFRTKTPIGENSRGGMKLVPVDPTEAQLLIAATAFSTVRLKEMKLQRDRCSVCLQVPDSSLLLRPDSFLNIRSAVGRHHAMGSLSNVIVKKFDIFDAYNILARPHS